MDTTTINFALGKMESAFAKVAPTITQITEKYIHYVVTKQILQLIIFVIILIAGIVLTRMSFKFCKILNNGEYNYNEKDTYEVKAIITGMFGGITLIVGIIGFMINGYSSALAITNPEMFTIEHTIDKFNRNRTDD